MLLGTRSGWSLPADQGHPAAPGSFLALCAEAPSSRRPHQSIVPLGAETFLLSTQWPASSGWEAELQLLMSQPEKFSAEDNKQTNKKSLIHENKTEQDPLGILQGPSREQMAHSPRIQESLFTSHLITRVSVAATGNHQGCCPGSPQRSSSHPWAQRDNEREWRWPERGTREERAQQLHLQGTG